MRVCSIASGSSGNCIYVGDGENHILIDAGVSRKRIVEGLEKIGVAPEALSGIFITHEHIDHIAGLPIMAKRYGIPIFATGGTLDGICLKDKKNEISRDKLYQLYADDAVRIGSLRIMPFSISHDAAEPVCYCVESGGRKFGMVTDLGFFDEYIVERLAGSNVLFVEANHDISMLEAGKYPYKLKCRILGEQGHLSNEDSGRLVCRLMDRRLKAVVLAHLSKENNYPELAHAAVKCQIWEELGINTLPFELTVAKRDVPSEPIRVEP